MAEAAVGFLQHQKLSTGLESDVNLISSAEYELSQLREELNKLKTFIREAAKKPKNLEQLTEIERQIREVVYEAEDTIDLCLTKRCKAYTTHSRPKNHFRRAPKKAHVSLTLKVRSLREEKVAPLLEKIHMMRFDGGPGADVEETWTRDKKPQSIRQDNIVGLEDEEEKIISYHSLPICPQPQSIRQDNIVGLDDEEEKIISYLMEPTPELDVISIIGIPGLGKTTLAWKIFQSQKMKLEFPIRIWVNISQVLNRREMLLTILKQFTSTDMSGLSDHDLDVTARKRLEDANRFLLVMDDVWSIENWNAIKDVLPKSNMASKVILTSRYNDVGTHANPMREPHKLRFMLESESWELLQLQVFGKLDVCPPELKDTGYDTAKQCKGLPLAVVVIGGLLLDRLSTTGNKIDQTRKSWLQVAANVSMFVQSSSEYNISEILEMSYNRLSYDLRDCFKYLGVFPEDYEIPTWRLIRLWIAEGFIMPKPEHSLERMAEENLKELIRRNLVMVDKMNPNNEVKTCRIHDVVREFCTVKAQGDNFYQETRLLKEGIFRPSVHEITKCRRLCIHSHVQEFLAKKPRGTLVRSFLSFNKVSVDLQPKLMHVIPDCFELLRVLDPKSIRFESFPKGVTKLYHLRYITMCCEDLDFLPKAFSELFNLQTIVVETNSRSLTIEANIWMMIELRHLKTNAAIVLVEGDGEGGENLQTLSRLSPNNCTEEVFGRARNLKTLGIHGDLNTLSSGTKSSEKLRCLEKLKLVHDMPSGDPLHGLPKQSFFPVKLRRLTISAALLEWKYMSTLAGINSLEILKLKEKAFKGMSWDASGHCFQQLHYLLIEDTDLAVWAASENSFPSLKSLVLNKCENLMEIPMGVTKSLKVLDIDHLGKSAVMSAMKIKENKNLMLGESGSQTSGQFKLRIAPGCAANDHHLIKLDNGQISSIR